MRQLTAHIVLRFIVSMILVAPVILLAEEVDKFRPADAQAAESSESAKPLSIGSWLNTPPDRQAAAFDLNFNRLYFNAEGKVVGRYNRLQRKFQAGDFRPAQWHNIASSDAATTSKPPARTPVAEKPAQAVAPKTTTGDTAARPPRYPIVPYPRAALPPPEPEEPKPAEVFRRGQTSGGSTGRARARVIDAAKP